MHRDGAQRVGSRHSLGKEVEDTIRIFRDSNQRFAAWKAQQGLGAPITRVEKACGGELFYRAHGRNVVQRTPIDPL
jgi:hypothetical protein